MIKLSDVYKLESFSDDYKWNPKRKVLIRDYREVEPDEMNCYPILLKNGLVQPINHDWIACMVNTHYNLILIRPDAIAKIESLLATIVREGNPSEDGSIAVYREWSAKNLTDNAGYQILKNGSPVASLRHVQGPKATEYLVHLHNIPMKDFFELEV